MLVLLLLLNAVVTLVITVHFCGFDCVVHSGGFTGEGGGAMPPPQTGAKKFHSAT